MKKTQHLFKSTFAHLRLSISTLMLCLLSCFRTKRSSPDSSHERRSDAQYSDYGSDEEIRDEAKFLKSCGTLVETPIEIRKKVSKRPNEDTSAFHSWLPTSSIDAFEEMDHSPTSPHPFHQRTSITCKSNTQESISNGEDGAENYEDVIEVHADDVTTPFTPWPSASNIQSRNKSVRFECDIVTSRVQGSSPENFRREISENFESPWQPSVSKRTPKPTPLKLTDEMQTPGTVFPSNAENYGNGKGRIRSQYVYSVSKPADLGLSVVGETN